ncbi:hypothetical protein BSZ35_05665 [Salinibacter sp. 10B]|uniref:hypothetical protein n=1 Tax=Salinibacter sp. 10B TaxID=1923971 RepID=UPI000CF3F047|nr:hypothetical protein [Salinibacter sp. 10B]PQJ34157.1 hypothetical protein BSZ35_05665 [Salinibacter sp. 10B]
MRTDPEEEYILRSALTLQRRTLWLGTIALYDDRLSITGWSWTGAVDHTLPLDEIRLVEIWPVPRGVNLAIFPEQGASLYCRIAEDILRWGRAFRGEDRVNLTMQPDHYPACPVGMWARPPLVGTIPAPPSTGRRSSL